MHSAQREARNIATGCRDRGSCLFAIVGASHTCCAAGAPFAPDQARPAPKARHTPFEKNNLPEPPDAAALCSNRAQIWRFISLNLLISQPILIANRPQSSHERSRAFLFSAAFFRCASAAIRGHQLGRAQASSCDQHPQGAEPARRCGLLDHHRRAVAGTRDAGRCHRTAN